MKYSVAAVSAFAAVALAKPSFTNLSFDVEAGKPFTLTFAGCSASTTCDIELQTGTSKALKDVKTLACELIFRRGRNLRAKIKC